ncbi:MULTISPECIES: hypothetical protein [unclassified Sphingobacterium]|uniref:hypothetical protein n=1 Tax=unclassified Sphingobacterium TaxID=2609468 RepID=UPI0025F21968|nr:MULTISPECIES: hypothetical protein [unclassified Sphingobacterium]
MQIEIDHNFYEIVSWNRDYIQIQGTKSPYRIYAPPYYDIASLKQYIKLNPPVNQEEDQSYSYLETPYYLFRTPYLVKIFSTVSPATIELKSSSICIYQRKNVDSLKLLKEWSMDLLYNELIKIVSYWEEQLDNYRITAIRLSKRLSADYKIEGNEISFSSRLIDLDKGHLNLIVLAAFCKFSKKNKKESEAIYNLYIPNWRELNVY